MPSSKSLSLSVAVLERFTDYTLPYAVSFDPVTLTYDLRPCVGRLRPRSSSPLERRRPDSSCNALAVDTFSSYMLRYAVTLNLDPVTLTFDLEHL